MIASRYWIMSHDGIPEGYAMYRRHYSSRKNRTPKIRQFVGPGEKMVLLGFMCHAMFVWRKEKYRMDGQVGLNCAVFRNESPHRSSDMIREAMTWAWQRWPGQRLYTFVNPSAIRSSNPGCCFKKAGWKTCGVTKSGLIVLDVAAEVEDDA